MSPHESVALIVADDLTGAADACAKLAAADGRSAAVVADLDRATAPLLARTSLVSISLDTRRRLASEARGRMQRAAALAGDRAGGTVFLKIDSTLRGHLAEEIEAALDAFGCTHAILTPAFPALRRRVIDGILIVDGPGAPPPIDIRARLGSETLRHRVRVADAANLADLDAVVCDGLASGGRPLWVGSAGLAEALGQRLPRADSDPTAAGQRVGDRVVRESSADSRRPGRRGPVVLCVGSDHPVTRMQVVRIGAHPGARLVDASPATRDTLPPRLSVAIGEGASGLVLTGGDTATDVCALLDVLAIDLGGEIETGVPWGVIHGGRCDGLPVILKAGGFGDRETLVRAVTFLSTLTGPPGLPQTGRQ